jgi:acylphosphatase
MALETAVRLIISGQVQGVGFRWWTVGMAKSLHLRGWVRNLIDGRVEILAIGPEPEIETLAAACRYGPSAARVTGIERQTAEDDNSRSFTTKKALPGRSA